jgi:hypothetical protein
MTHLRYYISGWEIDGTSSVYLLAGFNLVVLYLPFLLPHYLPQTVEVGLNLKTNSREAEHYFVQ